ncbi:hypothetical protein B0H10DRAFT_2211020 [Mycena sp. CBHHK59/15]|nr:hypothetical protein B0H10DRAFT_2232088 [Mycena sp. CBHHK59/15]KAJ6626743.1 hypothetical protein B0H10DRAFT_2211020 [Mycena sp. CBHHK59/15]
MSAPGKRGRGRPAKAFFIRGRAAAKKTLDRLRNIFVPEPPPLMPKPPEDWGEPLSGFDARMAHLADEQYGIPSARDDAQQLSIVLPPLNRAGWKLLDTINTEDCPRWFDAQKNDYHPHTSSEMSSIVLSWIGHPGDSPKDVRARKFLVRWDSSVPANSELRALAVKEARPVWRWEYICAGVHDKVPVGEGHSVQGSGGKGEDGGGEGEDGEDEGDVSNDEDAVGPSSERRSRWKKCSSGVKLHVEITGNDLSVVKIWQYGEHEDAMDAQRLVWSRHLRLVIMERLRQYGGKATAVNRDLVQRFQRKHSSGTSEPLPTSRVPTIKNIRQMVPAERQRVRLDRNLFRAVWLMVKKNPRDMYYYTPHNFKKGEEAKSKFSGQTVAYSWIPPTDFITKTALPRQFFAR